jgi:cell division topological specificity factor
MDWIKKLFGAEQKSSAQTAKERLLVVVSHQRGGRLDAPHYLPKLREELLAVVRRYVQVDDASVQVDLKREDGDEVLAMSITLPDRQT